MPPFFKCLIAVCICFAIGAMVSIDAAPPGFVEGHLKIISPKEVELADGTPSKKMAGNYAELSADRREP